LKLTRRKRKRYETSSKKEKKLEDKTGWLKYFFSKNGSGKIKKEHIKIQVMVNHYKVCLFT